MSRRVTLIARDPAGLKLVCLLRNETRQYYHVSVIAEVPGATGFEIGKDVLRLKCGDYRIIEGEHFDLVRQINRAAAEYQQRLRQWHDRRTKVMMAAGNAWQKRHPFPQYDNNPAVDDYIRKRKIE